LNDFIPSNQEFFPIVYAQSLLLPLPLPTLSSDPIEANIDDERSGNLTALRFDHQNAVECRGDINTGSRICLPYTFNIDGNVAGTFNLINKTIIPTGEWKFKCSAIKQGGVFFFPPLVLDFALNADGSDKDKIDFSYKLDDPEPGRISIHVIGEHPVTGVPCEIGITYFVGDIILRTGLIPARDTGLQGVFKNPIYSKDPTGNIISKNTTSTSKSFGNIDGFGEISRSIGSEWDFLLTGTQNNPPIAVATASPNPVESEQLVTLDSVGSRDPDPGDSITTFKWEQVSGPEVDLIPFNPSISTSSIKSSNTIKAMDVESSPVVQFIAPEVEEEETVLTFSLGVTDTHLASATTATSVTVKPKECISETIYDPPTPIEETYSINANFKDIPKQFTNLQGKKVASITSWDVSTDDKNTVIENGIVKCLKIIVKINQLFPELSNYDQLCSSQQKEWDRFISRVMVHEQGHVDRVHQFIDNLHTKMVGKSVKDAIKTFNKALSDLDKSSRQYDLPPPKGTNHGETQGAKLNTRIECN
jgi:hypothetical protein